ncbi:MAG: hypothetical protein V7K57_08680 [Nostoc sp.]|uniref:hypothetical protein n=1 Tax=Nostoc sp. TaxID=1180 RepID=UPI002FF74DCD
MTRYSIPAETPPQNLFTLTTDDRQLESVESFDWESRMARLVGFEEESSSGYTEVSEDSATLPESLSQPQEVQTKEPLSSNPFAKLGLVGAGTLAVVLVAGLFLSQLMNTSSPKPKNIVSPQARSQPTNESSSQQLASEVDTLKTKLALTEQAELVKAAQQNLRMAKPTPTVAVQPEPLVSSRGRQRVIPTSPPIAYVPRTVTVERIVKVPVSQPLPIAQLPVVKPDTQPVVITTPPPPPSPLEEWARLAKLGSYGQVNVTEQPNNVAATYAPPNDSQVQRQPPNPNPEQTPQPETPAPVVSQAQQQGQKSVAVGTSAKAVLATAIFGETTKSSNANDAGEGKNVFVIRLKEPLKSTDGAIALPANTEFLTEVRSLSEQGFLQMNVVKVVSQNNGNLTERSLPTNAIIIRGTQGKPLIANKFPSQGSSIASMDAGLFVLGGISKAAELINRSDTELQPLISTVTNADGTTSSSSQLTTVTTNRRNLAAGVVEGGLNSVVPQIAQRNQQAIAQMSQQTNVWFLPAGTSIEIYVNQVTQF